MGSGCSLLRKDRRDRYETLPVGQVAEYSKSREINSKGLWHLERGDLDKAESLFRDALVADVSYGPAHNNLGHLYLARRQLYLAAWEFEYASNLMPERIEPILNQGLVYEIAGRFDRASAFYEIAHELEPRNPVAIGNLARLRVKQAGDPLEIHHLLRELLLYDDRPDWIGWAELLLVTQYDIGSSDLLELLPDSPPIAPAPPMPPPPIYLNPPEPSSPATDPAVLPNPVNPASVPELEERIREAPSPTLSLQRRDSGMPFGSALDSRTEDSLAPATRATDPLIQKVSFDEILRVER